MSEIKIEKNTKKRGRGRPRKDRDLDDYTDAGPPPRDDILAIGHWLQRIVALTAHQARLDRGSSKVREGIRASCMAASRLLPSTITACALGLDESGDIDPSGPPPQDSLQISEWFLMNLVEDVYLQITGEANTKTSAEWRSASDAAVKVWPPDLLVEARRMLRASMGDSDGVQGPKTQRFESNHRTRSLNLIIQPTSTANDTGTGSTNRRRSRIVNM